MQRLFPYSLFVGLTSILGHVAFVTLANLGEGNRFLAWVKMGVVFGVAYFLMSSTHLERRYNSPNWVWGTFGAIGTIGTLLAITQLGSFFMITVTILLMPFMMTGVLLLLPYLQFALLALLLMIVNDLRRADEVDA